MKTNPFIYLTTALLMSGAAISSANDNICGGADDDQVFDAPSLCGGADDDQFQPPVPQGIVSDPFGVVPSVPNPAQPPVLQGMTTDPLGIPPPPPGTHDVMAMWAVLTGPGPVVSPICGGNGNDSFQEILKPMPLTDAMLAHLFGVSPLTGDSMDDDDLWGGGGTDEIFDFIGQIVGGDGADFLFGPVPLWGGGGTDEINAGDPEF